jgi:Transport and Golgi organisation 2
LAGTLSSQLTGICSNGRVCTAILDLAPGLPVLLAGVRDEFTDRAWQPPGRHWPGHPGLTGGRDLLAGGTWLAVSPGASRVTCILNGRGRPAPAASRRTRGVLPLQVADDGKLSGSALADFDPFHLLSAEPGRALMWSWDGERLTERELGAGLHLVVNSGLDSEVASGGRGSPPAKAGQRQDPREMELARLAYFGPRLRAAARPRPRPGGPVAEAWGEWLPLINGGSISPDDPRALLVRRDLGTRIPGTGRVWGTTSVSLVALWPGQPGGPPGAARYDFTAAPGDVGAWQEIALSG